MQRSRKQGPIAGGRGWEQSIEVEAGLKNMVGPCWCGSVGCSINPYNKGPGVRFPVRAHTQVVGSILGQDVYRRQSVTVSLSLFLNLSLKSINTCSGKDNKKLNIYTLQKGVLVKWNQVSKIILMRAKRQREKRT